MTTLADIETQHIIWLNNRQHGQQAVLTGLTLDEVDLHGKDLSEADFSQTRMHRAFLYQTMLFKASLNGTDLRKSFMRQCDLTDADLRGANLRDSDLKDAILNGASLYETDLTDADLRGADLRRTNTFGAIFYGAKLDGITMNWDSPQLIAERLWQAARSIDERMLAAFIGRAIGCKWWELKHPSMKWARKTMGGWIKPRDSMPEHLEELLKPYDDFAYFRSLQKQLDY